MSVSAFAGEVDRRANAEQARINEGVRSGELTRPEARELKIRREIARDRALGGITPVERAKINRDENRLSRDIAVQKHDAQVRY